MTRCGEISPFGLLFMVWVKAIKFTPRLAKFWATFGEILTKSSGHTADCRGTAAATFI